MNVLLMAKGTGGDIYPFLALGKELKQRGHEVTLLTHCCFAQTVAAAGISFAAIDTQDGSSERVFHDSVVTNTKDLLATTQRNIETDLAAETELIEQNCTHNTILVAHENLQLTVQTAADKLQLPAVLVFLSPSGLVNLPFLAEQYDMLSQTINRIRARIGLATTSDWRAWIAQANLALGFWPEWFAPIDPEWRFDLRALGFIADPQLETSEAPVRFREFLAQGEAPILISHGTSIPRNQDFFTASIAACRLLNRRAVVVTPFADAPVVDLPPRMEWFKRLPFGSIMPAMEAVIHHGGIGTTRQALAAGVPQAVLAFGFDRPYNAARVQALGAGRHLPPVRWNAENIAAALSDLSTTTVRDRCKDVAKHFQRPDAAAASACELIENLSTGAPRRSRASSQTLSTETAAAPRNVQALLERLSPAKRALLAARLRNKVTADAALQKITPRSERGTAPLSFAQQRMWILDRLVPGNAAYNLISAVRLTGALNVLALEQALREVVRRHEILRTTFTELGGQAIQVVSTGAEPEISIVDLSGLLDAMGQGLVKRIIVQAAQFRFDLTRGPLLRVLLLRLSEQDHVISLTMHHIIGDGRSTEVLTGELIDLYDAFSAGRKSSLSELPIQYADFAVWQREYLSDARLEEQLAYWKKELSGLSPAFEVPGKARKSGTRNFSGASPWFLISKELSEELKAFSRRSDVTLFMTLLAAFNVVVQIHTGKANVVIGVPNSNRVRAEISGLIGFFANALVFRTDLGGDPSFVDVLRRVKQVAQGAYAHQEVPFEKIVEVLQPERDLNHSPLFQVAFTLQTSSNAPTRTAALNIAPVYYELETAPYDLVLIVDDAKRGLGGVFNYSTELFDSTTIARMSQDYESLLDIVVNQPDIKLSVCKQLLLDARKQRSKTRSEQFEAASLQKLRSLNRQPVLTTSVQ